MREYGYTSTLPTANPLGQWMDSQLLDKIPLLLDQVQALDAKLDRLFVPLVWPLMDETASATADSHLSSVQEFANILMRQVHQQTNQQLESSS